MSSLPTIPSESPLNDIPFELAANPSPDIPLIYTSSLSSSIMTTYQAMASRSSPNITGLTDNIDTSHNTESNLIQNICNFFSLSIYYQNVRGLRTKCRDFYLSACACPYDIIVLTETWLNNSFFDNELFNDDFIVYRCDRTSLNSVYGRGGSGFDCC